jgi:hypothetical protein
MESLGYILIYFLKGALPWQGLKANTKKLKYDAIMEKKISTSASELCKGLPKEFTNYLDYCRKLRFEDKPDYQELRRMFRNLFIRQGYVYDYMFDWIVKKKQVWVIDIGRCRKASHQSGLRCPKQKSTSIARRDATSCCIPSFAVSTAQLLGESIWAS